MLINERAATAVLSGVAGYVDTAGFIALFGMFTAHVTGNLVASVGLVAEPASVGAGARLAMLPVFMTTVGATSLLTRAIRMRGRAPLRPLLAVMTIALAVFCIAGGHCAVRMRHDWAVTVIGGIGTAAMGVQNTLMRDILRHQSPTTLMTGNLTTFTIDLIDLLLPAPGRDVLERARTRRRLAIYGVPLGGFVLGALTGGYLTSLIGLWSIALPAAAVGFLSRTTGHWADTVGTATEPVSATKLRATAR